MNIENGPDGLAPDWHTHKSQSAEVIPMTAPHHVRGVHPAKRLKHVAQITRRQITGQIPYTDIHSAPLSWVSILVFRGCAKPREQIREMGLEAGNASAANDLASRLHQALILNSEPHTIGTHCTTLRYTHKVFSIFPPKYFDSPSAEKNGEKAWTNRLFAKGYRKKPARMKMTQAANWTHPR
jgi:hypothetical protein